MVGAHLVSTLKIPMVGGEMIHFVLKWSLFLWTTSLFSGGLHRLKKVTLTSWWSQPTHLRNIILGQMGSSPHKIGVTISRNETKTFFPRLEGFLPHSVWISHLSWCQVETSGTWWQLFATCTSWFSYVNSFDVSCVCSIFGGFLLKRLCCVCL